MIYKIFFQIFLLLGFINSLFAFDNTGLISFEKKQKVQNKDYPVGKSYYGRKKYIEYIPGNLPIVISVPHGGYEKPDELKDRARGSDHHDKETLEISLLVEKYFLELTGKQPYLIINRLHRIKLDPNREFEIAVQGDSLTSISYNEFHSFIDAAEKDVQSKWEKGFYIDLHAHNHSSQLIELGYLLESEILDNSDDDLNNDLYIEKSSIKNLLKNSEFKLSELIRGSVSFGAILEKYGYAVVPGPAIRTPGTEYFFAGGFNTSIHGPDGTNQFNSIQIELPLNGIRDSEENKNKFSEVLVKTIMEFLKIHYKLDLKKS